MPLFKCLLKFQIKVVELHYGQSLIHIKFIYVLHLLYNDISLEEFWYA